MADRPTRGTVVLDADACKGCELCVLACPPQVLVMTDSLNHHGYRLPGLLAGCTGCGACQLTCPDFALSVLRFDTPVPAGEQP